MPTSSVAPPVLDGAGGRDRHGAREPLAPRRAVGVDAGGVLRVQLGGGDEGEAAEPVAHRIERLDGEVAQPADAAAERRVADRVTVAAPSLEREFQPSRRRRVGRDGERARLVAEHQRGAAADDQIERAVAPGERPHVEVRGQVLDQAIALVEQVVRAVGAASSVARDDAPVQVGDPRGEIVDRVDVGAQAPGDLVARVVEPRLQRAEAPGERVGLGEHDLARGARARVGRGVLDRRVEARQGGGEPEPVVGDQLVDARGEGVVRLLARVSAGALEHARGGEAVVQALDAGDGHAVAGRAVGVPRGRTRLELHPLARVALGARVGDVVRRRRDRPPEGEQSRRRVVQQIAQAGFSRSARTRCMTAIALSA